MLKHCLGEQWEERNGPEEISTDWKDLWGKPLRRVSPSLQLRNTAWFAGILDLPLEAVRFVGPNGALAEGTMTLKALRAEWQKERS
jgi:hypothetical protein